ncbi:cardiolipin synthase [Clostridium sp. HBUAS56010]|uniref:cardiolipin synthase n=1 Tax=Clostridium sp. HBUAS56010 TaxID=2571127 RepID=UPI0011777D48|nr:cardiolipin synthase [Clostridium sp. HBUAS56010]
MKQIRGMMRVVFGRTTFGIVALIAQIAIFLAAYRFLNRYITYFYGAFTLLSALIIIYILNKEENPAFKLSWMIPIAAFPVFGMFFYLFVQFQIIGKLIDKKLKVNREKTEPYLSQSPRVMERLSGISVHNANLARFVKNTSHYPAYGNTNASYFPVGEVMFEAMKRELEQAERFIFLEFFIIERGEMWNEILEILERKVKEGVEVRLLYDGMCSITLLPHGYTGELKEKGIHAKEFSPVKPALTTYQNNRDHRKIVVVDGHTAFTGGMNLADEYINRKVRFGHWKDTGIMLKGDAAVSFTMMFLEMWNISEKEPDDYSRYLRDPEYFYPLELNMDGFAVPYADNPLDGENVGEQVYLNIIHSATRYVHIMTPYLILDYGMVKALTFAAKRGVETVIIMPGIPDKRYAFLLARSHYRELIRAGVHIYEYMPGFVHAKVFSSDNTKAVVGTINMDFRSLYLHFECAVYLYCNEVVKDIERDFQNTLACCRKIDEDIISRFPWYERFAGRALRLFAPLM